MRHTEIALRRPVTTVDLAVLAVGVISAWLLRPETSPTSRSRHAHHVPYPDTREIEQLSCARSRRSRRTIGHRADQGQRAADEATFDLQFNWDRDAEAGPSRSAPSSIRSAASCRRVPTASSCSFSARTSR
jgi:hypothetical protein